MNLLGPRRIGLQVALRTRAEQTELSIREGQSKPVGAELSRECPEGSLLEGP